MTAYEFGGTHVICDITSVAAVALNDHDRLLDAVATGIAASGATVCGMQVKEFQPTGLTALWLLSESHVSIHTYPDDGALFLDAFTCGERCRPERIADALVGALGRCQHRTSVMRRGIGRTVPPVPPAAGRAEPPATAPGRLLTPADRAGDLLGAVRG